MKRPVTVLKTCLALVLGAAMWSMPTTTAAQALYGSVTGTISDSSGAAVPGATVTLTNEETGLELTGVTDSVGSYTIRNVLGAPTP